MIDAGAPNVRRVAAMSRPTAATPMSASGTRIDAGDRPNRRTDRPITMVASGGLSTVMKVEGSIAPWNQAAHDWDAAHAVAE